MSHRVTFFLPPKKKKNLNKIFSSFAHLRSLELCPWSSSVDPFVARDTKPFLSPPHPALGRGRLLHVQDSRGDFSCLSRLPNTRTEEGKGEGATSPCHGTLWKSHKRSHLHVSGQNLVTRPHQTGRENERCHRGAGPQDPAETRGSGRSRHVRWAPNTLPRKLDFTHGYLPIPSEAKQLNGRDVRTCRPLGKGRLCPGSSALRFQRCRIRGSQP